MLPNERGKEGQRVLQDILYLAQSIDSGFEARRRR